MRRTIAALAAAALAIAGAGLTACGDDKEGPAEDVGKELDKGGKKAGDEIEEGAKEAEREIDGEKGD